MPKYEIFLNNYIYRKNKKNTQNFNIDIDTINKYNNMQKIYNKTSLNLNKIDEVENNFKYLKLLEPYKELSSVYMYDCQIGFLLKILNKMLIYRDGIKHIKMIKDLDNTLNGCFLTKTIIKNSLMTQNAKKINIFNDNIDKLLVSDKIKMLENYSIGIEKNKKLKIPEVFDFKKIHIKNKNLFQKNIIKEILAKTKILDSITSKSLTDYFKKFKLFEKIEYSYINLFIDFNNKKLKTNDNNKYLNLDFYTKIETNLKKNNIDNILEFVDNYNNFLKNKLKINNKIDINNILNYNKEFNLGVVEKDIKTFNFINYATYCTDRYINIVDHYDNYDINYKNYFNENISQILNSTLENNDNHPNNNSTNMGIEKNLKNKIKKTIEVLYKEKNKNNEKSIDFKNLIQKLDTKILEIDTNNDEDGFLFLENYKNIKNILNDDLNNFNYTLVPPTVSIEDILKNKRKITSLESELRQITLNIKNKNSVINTLQGLDTILKQKGFNVIKYLNHEKNRNLKYNKIFKTYLSICSIGAVEKLINFEKKHKLLKNISDIKF
jgi:hypothetical protein